MRSESRQRRTRGMRWDKMLETISWEKEVAQEERDEREQRRAKFPDSHVIVAGMDMDLPPLLRRGKSRFSPSGSPSGSRPGTNSQLSSRPATSSATHSRPVTRDAVGFGEPDADGGLGISRQITADDKRLADSRPTSKGSAGPGVITALWSRDEEGGSTRSEVSPMFRSCRSFESVLSARSHGEWVKTAPPGDVFYRTLPGSWAQVSGIQD
ncbi:unnamed protein product [Polarella glacialis]|uniref:Uncharacterized protein n=1 Tax=Polarella glacialis TaxID=89957 RepID=A0A813GHJ4_POLGL|nr:unnamed protein product [Polarella glacialis]